MKRRNFISLTASGIEVLSVMPSGLAASETASSGIRLGGKVFGNQITYMKK